MIRSRKQKSRSSKSTVLQIAPVPFLIGVLFSMTVQGRGLVPILSNRTTRSTPRSSRRLPPGLSTTATTTARAEAFAVPISLQTTSKRCRPARRVPARAERAWASPTIDPIELTTKSSVAFTSPTKPRTRVSRPTRRVSTSYTSTTCEKKTPRNALRSSGTITVRETGPIAILSLPVPRLVSNPQPVRPPGARDGRQIPSPRREQGTATCCLLRH